MCVPEGDFKFTVGPDSFQKVVERFGGKQAVEEWETFVSSGGGGGGGGWWMEEWERRGGDRGIKVLVLMMM